jgi:hypothetical protein
MALSIWGLESTPDVNRALPDTLGNQIVPMVFVSCQFRRKAYKIPDGSLCQALLLNEFAVNFRPWCSNLGRWFRW